MQQATGNRTDITTLATLQGAFHSITQEMSDVVVRTTRTPVFKLAKDFSCTLCDWDGRQVVQGDAELPVHVGSLPFVCKAVMATYEGDINPGDLFLCNDPEHGGIHLNDVALLRPVFFEDSVVFWGAIRAHWIDIGGPVPVDLRRAQSDSYGEGLRIPPTKITDRGEPRAEIMRLVFGNVRMADQQQSDLLAMQAALNIADKRLVAILEKYNVGRTKASVEELYKMTERRVRKAIAALPDGEYDGNSWLSAREGDEHIELKARVTIQGDGARIELSSPPQLYDVRNSPFGATYAAVGHGMAISLGLQPPYNDGLYRPLDIDYGPLGTVMNAQVPPAATLGCTTQPFCEIVDSVRSALSKAIPDTQLTAGWGTASSTVVAGIRPGTDRYYVHFQPNGGSTGGSGAAHGHDGWGGVGSENSGGAVLKEPIELLEHEMPFHIHQLEIRPDSGGAGKWRGGFAYDCEWEPLDHAQTARFHGTINVIPAQSVGEASSKLLEPKIGARVVIDADGTHHNIGGNSRGHVPRGGRFLACPPGGGGVGNPMERDPCAVQADVRNGVVTLEGASLDYGVAIDPTTFEIDEAETQKLRDA